MTTKMTPVRAAIFDLDGTLVDAFADITTAINVPLSRRGLPTHTVRFIHQLVGNGAGKLVEQATPPEHHHELAAIREEMMVHYRKHGADNAVVYDGALDLLRQLRADGVRLGLLTNKPHDVAMLTVRHVGITELFDAIQGEHGPAVPRKPDPRALQAMIAGLGAQRAVMVGDGGPDGEVAMACGIPFVACLWGTRSRAELEQYAPAAYADSVADLLDPIRRALGLSAPARV